MFRFYDWNLWYQIRSPNITISRLQKNQLKLNWIIHGEQACMYNVAHFKFHKILVFKLFFWSLLKDQPSKVSTYILVTSLLSYKTTICVSCNFVLKFICRVRIIWMLEIKIKFLTNYKAPNSTLHIHKSAFITQSEYVTL